MGPRVSNYGGHLFNPPSTLAKRTAGRRYVASSSSSTPSPPKQRLWLRLTIVTATAAGIGAYVRAQQGPESATLNPVTFTKYRLVAREPVSSNGSIFTLKPTHPEGNREVYEEAWKTGIWSVMFKQPQLQIGRDYTPLPPSSPESEEDDGSLRFFIRKDPFGEVSRYLHGLDVGSSIEVRGPRIECEVPSGTRQILFIAGGTGIAPALQAGHTLLRRTDLDHKPRIHILWANRRRDDCLGGVNDISSDETQRTSWLSGLFGRSKPSPPPVDLPKAPVATSLMVRELEALKAQYPGQVTVNYFVDEESSFIGGKAILGFTDSVPSGGPPGNKMILVSGPEGFISYMAGPKLWAQGMELQGPLKGIIKELDLKDWTVWKL